MGNIIKSLSMQINIAATLIKMRSMYGNDIFILSGTQLVPTFVSRVLNKNVLLTAVASESTNSKLIHSNKNIIVKYLYYYMLLMLEIATFNLSTAIIVEAPNVAKFLNIKNKLIYNGGTFVDLETFKITNKISNRDNIIGYVGRLSREKGILNFIEAVARILQNNDQLKFIIIGDGPLKKEVSEYSIKYQLFNKVEFCGWVDHKLLPEYLNKMKLLVLPSYAEGLPNIVLESMGCGTPVLGANVGGVPDVVIDGKTGYILKENTPDCIADSILEIFQSNSIELLSDNARSYIEKEYALNSAISRYEHIINDIHR
ncbi:glycosyltransferase family 4 protein [Methanocella sp. MCL-LM]|uniref:glycosyltransferase family 4 protein n=1 Tax=Methanocella sp. MCL-LM TaxID=3412035 RepID=UPI003C773B20